MIDTMPRFSETYTEAGFIVSDHAGEFPDEFAGSLDASLILADHRNGMHGEFSPVSCLPCRETNSVLPLVSTSPETLSA